MSEKQLRGLRIAVSAPVKGTFSYLVPKELYSKAQVGCRTLVPFGNRRVTGYILERISLNYKKGLKEILEILDSEALFPEQI